ncbi:hypothetical protein [Haloparvum sedimenti]|uniref:hypothetical protein n=1 Tax=Haloparvum sedimenti TaxID=1678448 RepID=UPI00071E6B30|nr:hypothetical protein [Haloparvum sedimenti]
MRRVLAVVLVLLGVALMLNPLYLPVSDGSGAERYVHNVAPAEGTLGEDAPEAVAYEDLDPAVREAFDRARAADENVWVTGDPDERVDALAYPRSPNATSGLTVVADGGTEYALWTYTTEPEPQAVVAQRVLVQPGLFLIGFFAVLGAVALAFPGRLGEESVGE